MPHFTKLQIVPPIIAHRGANFFAPENTIAAFVKAKELGINWVEFDVMLTADDELVVIHDETLERTTNGVGLVAAHSYADLQLLDAGSWFDQRFQHEKIPTLQSVLACLYAQGLSANIEIKALPGQEALIVKKCVELFHHPETRWVATPLISSFSREVLQHVRQQLPDSCVGFLMHEWRPDWTSICDRLQCVAVNVNHECLTPARVQAIKQSGRCLLAYTVNDRQRAEQLYAWGVDAVFSDCPPLMMAML